MGSQNGAKIDPKTRSKFKSEKVASWDRLGSILGRFGGCPGGIFIDFLLVFVLFRGNRLDKLSRRVLVATRRDLNILPWVGGGGVGRPLYFPYGSTRDFEEIECNIL